MSVIHYVRLAIASFYCLAGIAAFVTFLIIVNYAAAVWSLLTATASGVLIHLHCLTIRRNLQVWYAREELQALAYFAFGVFAVATSGLIFHLVVNFMEKLPILPVQQSQIIPAVWCLITLKSGLLLLYYVLYYKCDNYPEGSGILRGVDHDDQEDA